MRPTRILAPGIAILLLALSFALPLTPAETVPNPGQAQVQNRLYLDSDGNCQGSYDISYAMHSLETPLYFIMNVTPTCSVVVGNLVTQETDLVPAFGDHVVTAGHQIHVSTEMDQQPYLQVSAKFRVYADCPQYLSSSPHPLHFSYFDSFGDEQEWAATPSATVSVYDQSGSCYTMARHSWLPLPDNSDDQAWALSAGTNKHAVTRCLITWGSGDHVAREHRADSCWIDSEIGFTIPDAPYQYLGTVAAGAVALLDVR